ncbi:MAG TPA: cysteine desulfurase family protein [Candidatus Saccharimonadales bacterium]|jgi:cysteine desulfurase|nr:cysteine desulfurase family protein [Candidatus Saccharimonadales bacterium]
MDSIYLDYAAATPMDPAVQAAMQPYFTERFFNPSATYLAANSVRKDLEAARARIAHWLGARPAEVVFTAGGTEANNLAIRGILSQFPDSNVVTTAIEHESVLAAARAYAYREAPVMADGVVNVDELINCVDDSTVLVSIMYANNEVGTVQPIRQIARELEKIKLARRAAGNKRPLYLHTDAAQAAAYLDLHTARLGVDLLTINAGKIYGPKQVGALFVSSKVRLTPQVLGGGQERGLRSGTENVAGAIGLATALDMVQERRHEEIIRLQALQKLFIEQLTTAIQGIVVNGSQRTRLPNNVHITIPGADNERLIFQLDDAGILCAAGSACSADSGEPSHVLRAMGLSDADARASLRFTMGRGTTEAQVRTTVEKLQHFTA